MQTPNTINSDAPLESVNASEVLMNTMWRESVPDKNLDMIRSILCGEPIREVDRKHASLERFVRVSINTLGEDTQRKFDDLEHRLSL